MLFCIPAIPNNIALCLLPATIGVHCRNCRKGAVSFPSSGDGFMSKSEMRALCAMGTIDFLARGRTITKCPARRHGNAFPVTCSHRVMPRWQFNAVATKVAFTRA